MPGQRHTLDEHNVIEMVAAGRARWKIENENNNVLKNHGYHFEHNFAHGKQQLANFLAFLKSAPTFDVRMECSASLWGTL